MGLPLLRLPHLVITKLVDFTAIKDLTCLSLCSKRARNILIVCRRQNRFKGKFISATVVSNCTALNVHYCEIEVIQISNLENYMKIGYSKFELPFSRLTVADVRDHIREMETVKIGGQHVPFFRGKYTLFTFWEDETIGLRKCLDFARETFGMPVKLLEFSQNGMWAFDWINGWEEKIPKMTVRANGIQDDKLKYVMENCKSRTLKTRGGFAWSGDPKGYPSESFQFDLHELKAKSFVACTARWITLQNISTSFIEELEIRQSSMTNRDVNLFLRLWLVGGFPCLRSIYIKLCENLSNDSCANGIRNELRKTTYQHEFTRKGYEKSESDFFKQYDLQQRENGNKMASIRFYHVLNNVYLSVWK